MNRNFRQTFFMLGWLLFNIGLLIKVRIAKNKEKSNVCGLSENKVRKTNYTDPKQFMFYKVEVYFIANQCMQGVFTRSNIWHYRLLIA